MILEYYVDVDKYAEERMWLKSNPPPFMTYSPSMGARFVNNKYQTHIYVVIDVGDDTELATLILLSKKGKILS